MSSQPVVATEGLVLLGVGGSFHAELCRMLESVHLLRDFEPSEIDVLGHFVTAYEAPTGLWIFKEGERSNFLCILIEGRVDIIKEGGKRISTVRPGKTMGEMSVLDGFPYSASALVAENSKLIYFTRTHFDRFIAEHPQSAVKLISQIARLISLRLRQTTGILCDYL